MPLFASGVILAVPDNKVQPDDDGLGLAEAEPIQHAPAAAHVFAESKRNERGGASTQNLDFVSKVIPIREECLTAIGQFVRFVHGARQEIGKV